MMRWAKYRRAALLLLLLLPSIFFGVYSVSNSLSSSNQHRVTMTTSGQGWNLNLTAVHPSYFFTSQRVPVTVNLRLQVTSPNFKIWVNNVGVELREPLKINSTSGIVSTWNTLSSGKAQIKANYTSAQALSNQISLVATYPPSSSPFDPFVPASRVAINALANVTVYQSSGNLTTATPIVMSVLDGQTFYQTQLSTIASTSSWLVYQLVAALVVSVILVLTRPPAASATDRAYSFDLESYKRERSIARLEELMKSGAMSESSYGKLREKYEKEMKAAQAASAVT
jgi:uncharacterized membrane protein